MNLERARIVLCACIILAATSVTAQRYSGHPCMGGDPSLRHKLHSAAVGALSQPMSANGLFDEWSTSMLRPEGLPPESPGPCGKYRVIDPCEKYLVAYHAWRCMYCAGSAMDHLPSTAWAEGVEGDGIGEIVLVKVDITRPVRIWAGLGRSEALFRGNNRPRRVAVFALEGFGGGGKLKFAFHGVRVIGKREAELADVNNYQTLPLPAFSLSPDTRNDRHTFVAVEILSVYRGEKSRDTCISEINNAE